MNRFWNATALAALALLYFPAHAESITVTLKLKGKMTMEELADSVQNPMSNHFGRFYEPEEIRMLAAPSDSEYQELLQGLELEGLRIVSESPTHLWVTVRGKKQIYESLFATQVESLSEGRHRHLYQVSVPRHLNLVESVSGLDNTRKSRHHFVLAPFAATHSPGGIPQADIKKFYNFNPIYTAGYSGKNQHIAIATYDGYKIDNVRKFYSLSSLRPVPSVDQVNFNGVPTFDSGSAMETELDAEFAGMIAPGAKVHVFASAHNDDQGEVQLFTAILDDNRSKIVNYSWGGCEEQVDQQHQSDMQAIFARAIAQGVNILAASGDSGSDSCGDGGVKADWPAANPYIIAVGGTSLNMVKSKYKETGWTGSGGGISGLFALPAWQNKLGSQFVKRSYPDVAFNADPGTGQAIYTTGGWNVLGGTSMAAPQWAGFLALVGEMRQAKGRSDLGFLNAHLYAMSAANKTKSFHDITSGKNGAYQAKVGWDAVTGLGSLNAQNLATYLTTQ